MAFDRVGQKSAAYVVVLLVASVCEAGTTVSGPTVFSAQVRFEAGSEWVEYGWFMPGFGLDPDRLLVVKDSEGGDWQPNMTLAEWMAQESGHHAGIRTIAAENDESMQGLLDDLSSDGSMWLTYREENPGDINNGSWSSFFSAQEQSMRDSIVSYINDLIIALGVVALAAAGGLLAFLLIKKALDWGRVASVGSIVLLCIAWVEDSNAQPGECLGTDRVPGYIADGETSSGFPHPDNPLGWTSEVMEQYTPKSIGLVCLTGEPGISGHLMLWQVTGYTDDDFGRDGGIDIAIMWIFVATRFGPDLFEPQHRWEEYPLIQFGTSPRTYTRRFLIMLAEALKSDVPITSGYEVNSSNKVLPDSWLDGTFVDEFKDWIESNAYDHAAGIKVPDIGCRWNSSLLAKPDEVPFIYDQYDWVYSVPGNEWEGMPCGVDLAIAPPIFYWTWVPSKGGQTLDTTLTQDVVAYFTGEINLGQLLGWLSLPEDVSSEDLHTTFLVPLPWDSIHSVDITNGVNVTSHVNGAASGLAATLNVRGLVRLFVIVVWSFKFGLGCIRVVSSSGDIDEEGQGGDE